MSSPNSAEKRTDNMTSSLVRFRHDVKEKRFNVKIQGFVVEKEFGQEAEILTVHFVFLSVDFENGNLRFAVDFVAGRMAPNTLGQVAPQDGRTEGEREGRGRKRILVQFPLLTIRKSDFDDCKPV